MQYVYKILKIFNLSEFPLEVYKIETLWIQKF